MSPCLSTNASLHYHAAHTPGATHPVSILIVGTLAFDCIETPHGQAEDVFGGSASFSSYVATFFGQPRLVAIVGEDFPDHFRRILSDRGVDLAGVHTREGGKTFRWRGRYHTNMNDRDTLEVHLNVLGEFDPKVPESFRDSKHVFLANLTPAVQLKALEQLQKPTLVMADTMDLWIETARDDLLKLFPKLDVLLLNDSEARLFTGQDDLVKAGRKVLALGSRAVIIKKGEHGAMLFDQHGIAVLPAFPTDTVVDPTGAGDSFAAGILGYLSTQPAVTPLSMRQAMGYGAVVASFCVEDYGLDRLTRTERSEIDTRWHRYREMLALE
jgi:sugar/nucleoside kinase (ribokinase family)